MAGQQLFGSAMIGEYFRDFAGYAAIALSFSVGVARNSQATKKIIPKRGWRKEAHNENYVSVQFLQLELHLSFCIFFAFVFDGFFGRTHVVLLDNKDASDGRYKAFPCRSEF